MFHQILFLRKLPEGQTTSVLFSTLVIDKYISYSLNICWVDESQASVSSDLTEISCEYL